MINDEPLTQEQVDELLAKTREVRKIAPKPEPAETVRTIEATPRATVPIPEELRRVQDIALRLTAEIGEGRFPVGYFLSLGIGTRIPLDSRWTDPLVLRLNGKSVGRGKVVLVGNKFGVEVTEWGGG